MTGPMFVALLALAAILAVGAWVLADVAAQRPHGRHRAGRVIEGELVEETVPLPVGRWQ